MFAYVVRRLRYALLLAAALLSGCALPPLHGRGESSAFAPDTATTLGRELAPLLRAHAGKSGVVPLQAGLEAFATRVHLADVAERSLDLQYYIWRADLTGTLLMQAVLRAADRGVRVRLLLDDNNTAGLDAELVRLDAHPNIELRLYNPVATRGARWLGYLTDLERLNRRMHNKSFTVDGWASVVGGRNIGDEYFNAAHEANFVDLDVLVVGQVVPGIAREFDRYWASASAYPARLLLPPAPDAPPAEVDSTQAAAYLQALSQDTAVRALRAHRLQPEWVDVRLVVDDPGKTTGTAPQGTVGERFAAAMGVPRRELFMVSPYFVPSDQGIGALVDAAGAGVDLRVLTNSFRATDVSIVHAGYIKYRADLLRGGVRLFELKPEPVAAREPGVAGPAAAGEQEAAGGRERQWVSGSSRASLHAKTAEVDRQRVYVGSFNFDPRSMEVNTELGLVIESPVLAGRLAGSFERAAQLGYEVKLDAQGRLVWIDPAPADGQGGPVEHATEPGTSWFQRLLLRILSWLPIESLL